jgi:hypothetical protein
MGRWMGIRTAPTLSFSYGNATNLPPIFAASSSLGYYGLDWDAISADCGRVVRRFDVPGASPCELEACQKRVPEATACVVVVSLFDLDETYFSNFRAALVPLSQTISDLIASHSPMAFFKRTLAQYPEHWIKILFPTAGSSTGLMVTIRTKIHDLTHRHGGGGGDGETKAVMNGDTSQLPTERTSDWDKGRLLRNVAGMKASSQNEHFFDGPKHLAFLRMLSQASKQGKAIVVVMPVSPDYRREMLTPELIADFEKSINEIQKQQPSAVWIRMDKVEKLDSSEYFWDLVHLNVFGRKIATEALTAQLKPALKPE